MHPMTRAIRNAWHLRGAGGTVFDNGAPLSCDSPGTAAVVALLPVPSLTHQVGKPGLETGQPHSREEWPPGTLAVALRCDRSNWWLSALPSVSHRVDALI